MSAVTGRVLFWTLATAMGVLFQTAAPRPPAAVTTSCPENIARLVEPSVLGRSQKATLACRGWTDAGLATDNAPADVLVRDVAPFLGDPCQDQHYYRITFIEDAHGVTAVFPFAGGTSTGSTRLSSEESKMISSAEAYATDVQLGTYVPSSNGGQAALACRLDPTYHFYCPAIQGVDHFCLTWVRRNQNQH